MLVALPWYSWGVFLLFTGFFAAGKLGVEGKEYVVQDGDIMHFLFNV